MSSRSEVTPETAGQIHDNAVHSRIQSDHALTTMLQTVRGTDIAALDRASTLNDRKETLKAHLSQALAGSSQKERDPPKKLHPVVDLEAMFGSLDYCECSHCNSINSPAAYFVELLQFYATTTSTGTSPSGIIWERTV